MRPPPLDTSFIYNGPSTHHVQYHHQYQQQQQQQQQQHQQQHQYEYNNSSTVYPNTPSVTSRPQSTYYQTPPSSNGSSNNNNSNADDSNIRSRRISVTTGDNGWKVGGAAGKRSSVQQQPRTAVVDGADFHERRMRRQSTGTTIFEPPITPAYTPKTPGNKSRDSYYGYFSQTHATMSPQELVAPTMPPQPITKRESFVGGFILPPAYPPYRSQQQQQQYPQTPHTPHHSQQYPTQTPYASHAQQYSTHTQQHTQQQYPHTPHTPHHSQHQLPQRHSYYQNMHHQQYQQQPTTSTAGQQYACDHNSYNSNNNSHPQQQHNRNRSTSASSYYYNDNNYNSSANDEITFPNTPRAEYSGKNR